MAQSVTSHYSQADPSTLGLNATLVQTSTNSSAEQVAAPTTPQVTHKVSSVLGTSPTIVQTSHVVGSPVLQEAQSTGSHYSQTDPSAIGLNPAVVHVRHTFAFPASQREQIATLQAWHANVGLELI